jgi:hypothetical protein
MQVRVTTALSAVVPSATTALLTFVCPQQHWLRRVEVARVGFSVPAHRYHGQDISTIGIEHQHGAAQALFAGFRRSYATPDKYNDSAGWTTTSLASGTYPQADVTLPTPSRHRCAQVCLNIAWTYAPHRGYVATPR